VDKVVPASFSASLYQQLRAAEQPAELYLYPQGDHNIRVGFDEAMQRTLRCLGRVTHSILMRATPPQQFFGGAQINLPTLQLFCHASTRQLVCH